MDLLTVSRVARITTVPKGTLYRWAADWERDGAGEGPRPIRLSGNHVRYIADDVTAWLAARLSVPIEAARTLVTV